FDSEAAGEMRYGRLRHAVERLAGQRYERRLRREVDDATEAALPHRREGRPAGEEGALEVHVDRVLEIRNRHRLGGYVTDPSAGVVDEEVKRPELVHGRHDRR